MFYTLWNRSARPVLVSPYRESEIGHIGCCNYLLLYNNYPETYQLKTTNIYHITVSVNQEFGYDLSGWFWLKVSCEVAIKMLARAEVISRLHRGWRICFQDGALLWLLEDGLSSLLLSEDLSPLPHKCSMGLYECLHSMVVGFSSEWVSQRKDQRKRHSNFFFLPSLGIQTPSLHHSVFIRSKSLSSANMQEEVD